VAVLVRRPGSIRVTMTEFRFEPGTADPVRLLHGGANLLVVNEGTVPHDMTILAAGHRLAKTGEVSPGGSSLLEVGNLPAGAYEIVCSQPGHVEAGMVGTIVAS